MLGCQTPRILGESDNGALCDTLSVDWGTEGNGIMSRPVATSSSKVGGPGLFSRRPNLPESNIRPTWTAPR